MAETLGIRRTANSQSFQVDANCQSVRVDSQAARGALQSFQVSVEWHAFAINAGTILATRRGSNGLVTR